MTHLFDPTARSIILPVRVGSPTDGYNFDFALDTGATQTVIRPGYLERLGDDLSRPFGRTRIRTASGSAVAPLIRVASVFAFGRLPTDFVVAAHDLPATVAVDGLLGLDFFRGLVLTLDFARGRIRLRARRWWQF